MNIQEKAQQARKSSLALRNLDANTRNTLLHAIAQSIQDNMQEILIANTVDIQNAEKANIEAPLLKRLSLNEQGVHTMCDMLHAVASQKDLVYSTILTRELARDLVLYKRYVPLGVIAMIFESRPDALVQIVALCLKTANSVLLKGGKEACNTNRILFEIILNASKLQVQGWIHLLESREEIQQILPLHNLIDMIIPRGSNNFVNYIMKNSLIPVLGHADGVCHVYVHYDADLVLAKQVLYDAKLQYTAVCNAMECLVLHDKALIFLPQLIYSLAQEGVFFHADEESSKILTVAKIPHKRAEISDWGSEYLNKTLAICTVKDTQEAVEFINTYGSGHTDVILTQSRLEADYFKHTVDSASVMWNCSSRFADGYRYGLGAELGISTSRIHARGPVGQEGLLTTQWILDGKGHTVQSFQDGERVFTHRDIEC